MNVEPVRILVIRFASIRGVAMHARVMLVLNWRKMGKPVKVSESTLT